MNCALKGFTNYLKYQGVQVDDEDASKILDLYMRITIALITGQNIHSGLNIVFSGKNNLDFSEMTDDGVQSIIDYVIDLTDSIADHKLSADTTNSIISGRNIITVLNAAHLFITTVIELEHESIMKIDHPALDIDLQTYSFINHNSDGTCLTISGYITRDDDGTKHMIYDFVSNCFIDGIPDEVISL